MKDKIFKDLFILDMANNHFGDLNHAKKIVNLFSKVKKKYGIRATIKFQFRDLPNFIHKDYRSSNLKYVRRFLDTKLEVKKFFDLYKFIKKNYFLTSCTPFDENSVDIIEKFKFDYIKIASVSALDFNLHERVAKNNIPKIISTGGIEINEIDKIVSFYSHKKQKFAIMHCVSSYPTNNKNLNLKFIKNLKSRYGNIPIGWSTHEYPDEILPVVISQAFGASIFEKHIGIESKKYPLNKYSLTPELFEIWLKNFFKSKDMIGSYNKKIFSDELKTIKELSRGVYAKNDIKKNTILTINDVYFAIPYKKKQLASHDFKENIIVKKNIKKDKVIFSKDLKFDQKLLEKYKIKSYLHKAKAMLNYNKIKVGESFDLEISHHKGINNFEKVGCFLFNIVNKQYAKKIIVMLPNQKHPSHFHKSKSETFIIISGSLKLTDDKNKYALFPGDKINLRKSTWHEFEAGAEGCIFEEISTTSFGMDSYYKNKSIKKLKRDERKTYFNNWFEARVNDEIIT